MVMTLTPEQWNVLRAAWREGLANAMPVCDEEHVSTAEEAAAKDQWSIIARSGQGEFLAFEKRVFILIKDDEEPRGVNVTDAMRRLTAEGLNLTRLFWSEIGS